MVTCNVDGIFVGVKESVNRNGQTSRYHEVFVPEFSKQVPIFRFTSDFSMGQAVSIPCELRLRQDGSPYFVYLAPSDAQQNQLNNKNSSFKKEE